MLAYAVKRKGMKIKCKILRGLAAVVLVFISAVEAVGLPNLTPYQPSGWSDKIVVARTASSTTDSTSLTTADTLYVNAALINDGTSATSVNFNNEIFVDGVPTTYWVTIAPLNVNFYSYLTTGYSIGQLSAGTHTVTVTADNGGVIAESNEGDNSYTKTITVSNPAQPNLTPYQPSGWSDKIVVARTASSTTDSTSLTTADTLYVNAAVINDGATATSVNFNNEIYVDGVPITFWVTTAPLNVNSYSYLTTGYSIGQLSAGTHTITVTADYGGVIAESNESDNSYTKTITVSNPPQPNLTPYQPSGWSDKIVVATTASSTTDSTSLTTADTLYVNAAVINDGAAATSVNFNNELYVDGVPTVNWVTIAPLDINSYSYLTTGYSIGQLSAGTHTVELVADYGGVIAESNESDNTYTKTITVSLANLPAPTLDTPANGSTGQTTTPAFSWSSVTGASSYRIIVATNAADLPSDPTATNGGPSMVTNATPATTNFIPTIPLNAGTTYYWEVHARSATQYGTWSSVNSFTTSPLVNGLTIIPIWDSSIVNDPQAATIEATINSAIAVYESDFSDPITVSIKFQEMNSGLGQSTKYITTVSYANYYEALVSLAKSADDSTALAHLPNNANNPINGNQNITLCFPLARVLGVNVNPPSGQPDGTIGLYTGIMNLSAAQTNPNNYSLFATVSHEIDEVLGLGSSLNGLDNGGPSPAGAVYPEDLFRYDQNAARSLTTALYATSFFSLDGTTDLAQFNQVASGDFGDWYSYYGGQTPQVQDAFQTPGATPVLGVELRVLDVIGYDLVTATAPAPTFQTVTSTANKITFTWTAVSGRSYQVQDTTNLVQTAWNNLGSIVIATGSTASFSDSIGTDHQRFYRVALLSAPAPNLMRSHTQIPVGPISIGTNYLRTFHP